MTKKKKNILLHFYSNNVFNNNIIRVQQIYLEIMKLTKIYIGFLFLIRKKFYRFKKLEKLEINNSRILIILRIR